MRHWKTGTKGTLPADGREKERQRLQCFLFAPDDFPTQGQFLLSSAPAPPIGMSCFLPPTPQKGQREATTPLTSPLLFFICPSDLISCLLFSVVNAVTTTIKLSLSRNEIMTKNTSFILLHSQLHLFLRAVGGAREEYYIVLYTL